MLGVSYFLSDWTGNMAKDLYRHFNIRVWHDSDTTALEEAVWDGSPLPTPVVLPPHRMSSRAEANRFQPTAQTVIASSRPLTSCQLAFDKARIIASRLGIG